MSGKKNRVSVEQEALPVWNCPQTADWTAAFDSLKKNCRERSPEAFPAKLHRCFLHPPEQ